MTAHAKTYTNTHTHTHTHLQPEYQTIWCGKMKHFLLKKDDVQKYLRDIFSDIINDIIEMDNKNVFMEPNRIRDSLGQKNKIEDFKV